MPPGAVRWTRGRYTGSRRTQAGKHWDTAERPPRDQDALALIADQSQETPCTAYPGRPDPALRDRLISQIQRLGQVLPPDAPDPLAGLLNWATKRTAALPDEQLPRLAVLLTQPTLAAVALTSLKRDRLPPTRGTPVDALWPHWVWLTRLTELRPGEPPLGWKAVRQRLCPGVPARAFGRGWPEALDVLTLHTVRHWSPPGLDLLDRIQLANVLWDVTPVPPPPDWLQAASTDPRETAPPGLSALWVWLNRLQLDPVADLRRARRAGLDPRDIAVLDPDVWYDLLAQLSSLQPDRPPGALVRRPVTLRALHDVVSPVYREATNRDANAWEREFRRERVIDDTAYFEGRRNLAREGLHRGEADRRTALRTILNIMQEGERPTASFPQAWSPQVLKGDAGYQRLQGPFGDLEVQPVWTGGELQTVSRELENCASLFVADLTSGHSVFLAGRGRNGRAQLLCQLVRTGELPVVGEDWTPLQVSRLYLREVKWANNRRLTDAESVAWTAWLTARGVPV